MGERNGAGHIRRLHYMENYPTQKIIGNFIQNITNHCTIIKSNWDERPCDFDAGLILTS